MICSNFSLVRKLFLGLSIKTLYLLLEIGKSVYLLQKKYSSLPRSSEAYTCGKLESVSRMFLIALFVTDVIRRSTKDPTCSLLAHLHS